MNGDTIIFYCFNNYKQLQSLMMSLDVEGFLCLSLLSTVSYHHR